MEYWNKDKALNVSNLNKFGDEASKQAIVNQNSEATDKVYSANYINNLKKWKLHQSVTGTTEVILPQEYDELLIITDISPEFYINLTFIIPKLFLDSSNRQFVDGWYSNSNSYGSATIFANNEKLYVYDASINGTDKKNVAVTKVYYR